MPRHPPCALKNFDTLQIFHRDQKTSPTPTSQEKTPDPKGGKLVLNIWDARVHCAVLKQRTTRRHPARLPPQETTPRRAVHTSPRPVSIKTTNPNHPHQPTRTNPADSVRPARRPIASGPNSVLANPPDPATTTRSPTNPEEQACTSRRPKNRPGPSSQCSTHEQPPDTRTVPQMACLTPTPRGKGIRCSLERR